MISLAHVLAYPALIGPQLRDENVTDTLYMDKIDGSWYTSIFSLCAPFGELKPILNGVFIRIWN